MTDETTQGGQELADATAGDDPSVAHDPLAEAIEAGAQTDADPTPDTSAAATANRGEGGPEGQEGSPDAEAPGPEGVEAGETTSVPTLRGPGPGEPGDDAQA